MMEKPKHPKAHLFSRGFQEKNGSLGSERVRKWDDRWVENFSELRKYKEKHGNCNVPFGWPENPKLSRWVSQQRKRKAKDKLSEEQIRLLDQLGFVWVARPKAVGTARNRRGWEENFRRLKNFKEKYGHCNVLRAWSDKTLIWWIVNLRRRKKQQSEEQIRKLDAIGFTWTLNSRDASWEEIFLALTQYYHEHGGSHVPVNSVTHGKLARWVGNQRWFRRKGGSSFTDERIRRLDGIGFQWEPLGSKWAEMFAALANYRERCGHCNVPAKFPEYPELGRWVSAQRQRRKAGKLNDGRTRHLDKIGFRWEIGPGKYVRVKNKG